MDIKIDEWFLPFDEEQESVYREISDSYYIVFRVRAEIFIKNFLKKKYKLKNKIAKYNWFFKDWSSVILETEGELSQMVCLPSLNYKKSYEFVCERCGDKMCGLIIKDRKCKLPAKGVLCQDVDFYSE